MRNDAIINEIYIQIIETVELFIEWYHVAWMKRLITAQVVLDEYAAGRRRIEAPVKSTIVTPEAWSKGHELGVVIDQELRSSACDRAVDASGVVLVKGASVRLGEFAQAGPGRKVGLADLITSADGSPMTAGIMSWGKDDSFPWTLDYDEVDLVLEGVLRISIEGRTVEGKVGDVIFIPKGSQVIFGTPSRTRVYYVTYPADWAAAGAAPVRPQK